MGRVGEFEQLVVWQRARQLAVALYALTRNAQFRADWGLAGQIQRAAVSIMANLADGHERGSPREFVRFIQIAKGSCAELRSHLYLARDVDLIAPAEAERHLADAAEIGRMLGALRRSILASNPRATKDRPRS